MTDNNQHRFTFDVSINFGIQITVFFFSSITSIIIARVLGPSGKGIYSLAITIPTMAAFLVSMGLNYSNIYLIGKKKYPIGTIVANSFLYSLCAGSLAAILLFVLSPFFAPRIFNDYSSTKYLYLTLPTTPFLLLLQGIHYILLGHRKMWHIAAVVIARPLVYLIVLIFFFFLGLSIYKVVLSYIAGVTAAVIVGVYIFAKSNYFKTLKLSKNIFVESFIFGCKQHLGAISQLLNFRLDLLIIAAFLSPKAVGLYSIAVLIGEIVWYISRSVAEILYSKTASSEEAVADSFTPLVCRNITLLTFLACLILYLLSGKLIPLIFTPQFLPSVTALHLLLPGIFFFSISRILSHDLTGRGFPQYSSYASFIALITTISFDMLLIPRFGINGASVASSIAYTVHAFIIIYLFKKTTGTKILNLLVFKSQDFLIYKKFITFFMHKMK